VIHLEEYIRSIITESTEESSESYGLFIRVPQPLASEFPPLTEDSSPPHITFLYIGNQVKDLDKLIEDIRVGLENVKSFKATLNGVEYFRNETTVPHIAIELQHDIRPDREQLKASLLEAGHTIQDHWPTYNPHITLAYVPNVDKDYEWDGVVPEGSFMVNEIELWGDSPVMTFSLS
jgi:2'-5' RNA ligase